MNRVAVFVDAGYLYAEGCRALTGRKLARSYTLLDQRLVVAELTRVAREASGLPLLRIYWYDGTANRPTRTQIALAEQGNVKLRLGRIDGSGRQKGVDALIASDLVALARNRAMADCVLLSGDDELRIAVHEIQQFGVRVHLVGIGPVRHTQSRLLRREADSASEWDGETLARFMRCETTVRSGASSSTDGTQPATLPPIASGDLGPLPESCGIGKITQHLVGRVLIEEFARRTGGYPRSRVYAATRHGLPCGMPRV